MITFISIADSNNLSGTLPTEVAALKSLSELHVYDNTIGGSLPTELGSLSTLLLLDLEVNKFQGQLFFPELLKTAGTLQKLRGSYNNFVDSIPSWIGDFSGLQEFWAIGNSFTGSIPTEITRLTDLGTLLPGMIYLRCKLDDEFLIIKCLLVHSLVVTL